MNPSLLATFLVGAAAAGQSVGFVAHTVEFTAVYISSPVTAAGTVVFQSDGDMGTSTANVESIVPAFDDAEEWLRSGTPSNWQVKLSKTAGDDTNVGSALDTWHDLSSNISFGMTITGSASDTRTGTFTVEFRKSGDTSARVSVGGLVITAEIL